MSEVERLRQRVTLLEGVIGFSKGAVADIRRGFPSLEPMTAEMLAMLLKREFVSRSGLYTVLYGARPDADMPNDRVMDIQMMRLRRHLEPHGITIETIDGDGWFMSKADKAKLRAVLAVAEIPEADLLEAAALANDLYHKRKAAREAQTGFHFEAEGAVHA